MDKRTQQALVIALVQPIDGSSSTYITPTRPAPIWPPDGYAGLHRRKVFLPSGKVQVIQADVNEEFQTIADLFKDFSAIFAR